MVYRFDKKHNLVTISNSILKHFTGHSLNETDKELDEILSKKPYEKIVVMLFDGLGKSIRRKHLSNTDFLVKKERLEISSVFPPTTAAATTAFLTGLYPNQNGWIGWQQYFKQHDLVVEMFTNCNAATHERIPGPSISELYCPYTSILELIKEQSNTKTYELFPHKIKAGGASLQIF